MKTPSIPAVVSEVTALKAGGIGSQRMLRRLRSQSEEGQGLLPLAFAP
jgi:hypothetical protein